jgi:cytochrome c oxidase assembly protein subunit 15
VIVISAQDDKVTTQLRDVRRWLAIVAIMIAAMVIVGGATRLTESGLSIVEWKPVTGTLPPLSEPAWTEAFEAYQAIPQYQQINRGMSLAEFKTIFWWEWSHRLLGRTIGAVFLLPFLFFLWRGGLSGELKRRLWLIFGLGALQGAVGWWMVASGLSERTEVSQYRLAAHLILAVAILCAVVWTRQRLRARLLISEPPRYRVAATFLLALTILQMYFGALVAGLRAGKIYNTWPLIDGAFIPSPDRLFFDQPWWRNLFENLLTVQFEHRMTAYALFALALWHLLDTTRSGANSAIMRGAALLAAAVTAQATLGILTLVNQAPLDLALTHQAMALVVVVLAVAHCERLTPPARERRTDAAISFAGAKAQPPSA